jgi:SAM-dependent methyltransferase
VDHVDEWSALADAWSRYWAPAGAPTQRAILDAAGVGPGSRVLDVGCGTGELVAAAVARGADVAGCDAAVGMIDVARVHSPEADLRVAEAERLPWPDDAFDLVTLVNALAFTDVAKTLAECRRVGDRVAVATWAEDALNDLTALERAVAGEDHEPSGPGREEGYLGTLLAEHGFTVETEQVAEAPMVLADADEVVAAVMFGETEGLRAELRPAVLAAARPFRRPDGSYVLRNAFRWALASR